MRRHRVLLGCFLAVIVVWGVQAEAGFAATDVYLPSVGRGSGLAGSDWYTTIWVFNPGTEVVNVQYLLYERNGDGVPVATFSDTIQSGDTVRYPNAVENMFGMSVFGAIRVVADADVMVNSRIYSVPEDEGEAMSSGQFFSGMPAGFAIGLGESTDVLGVYQTDPQNESDYRFNFGFVETAGGTATVRVDAVNDLGVIMATHDYEIGPFQPQQKVIANLAPGIDQENVRLHFEVVAGDGRVLVFGSGLANASNDPSTFEMMFDDVTSGDGVTQVNAGDGLTGGGSDSVVTLAVGAADGIEVTADAVGIADQGVTKPKIAAAGGTAGQVLGTDGSVLTWLDVSTGDGTISGVTAGDGLTGGGSEGAVVLNVGADEGLIANADAVGIASAGVTKDKLAASGGTSGQVLTTDGSGLVWADAAEGTISGVTAGEGLSGGGTEGVVALDVGAGDGLETTANNIRLANAGVTKPKIAAPGGSNDQVLATDGLNLMWVDQDTFALPYSGTVATPGKAFHVENTFDQGQGWAGFFKNTDPGNDYPALVGSTEGSGVAVYGNNLGTGAGVKGMSSDSYGVEAVSNSSNALKASTGSSGFTPGGHSEGDAAIWAESSRGAGLWATIDNDFVGAVRAENSAANGRGVEAYVTGSGAKGLYVIASQDATDAAFFSGNVDITGNLTKSGGSFRIDHPLYPDTMVLSHSFVESPDMLNVYNGNVVLDGDGRAVIELPEWFEALNRDFRYQLTPIGGPGPNLHVSETVSGNRFMIAGGEPGMTVSWQVTGVRQDAWAQANRIQVEEYKEGADYGRYLQPEVFGVPPEEGIGYHPED